MKKHYVSAFILLWFLVSIGMIQFVQAQGTVQQPSNNIDTELAKEDAAIQTVQYAETGLVGAWYISFPLQGYSSTSQRLNTVFDHSMPSYYGKNGITTAFTGEVGERQYGVSPVSSDLYKQQSGQAFSVNGTYTGGSWGTQYLSYDGHPGIDYRASAGTDILAPADGRLYIPTSDSVNGSPSTYNTFVIDHGNGYSTWILHSQRGSIRVAGDVRRGDVVAKVGDEGVPGAPHLHFEIRRNNVPVDPYGWAGSCRDPYTAAISTNLWTNSGTQWDFSTAGNTEGWSPSNVECFSVHDGGFYIDPSASDPYIQGPPLVNINASSFNTIEIRMASNAPDSSGAIYFITANSPNWDENKKVNFTVTNDGNWRVYSVRMDGNSYWSGSITGIRIDPSNTGRAGTSSDTIGFDYIKLTSGGTTTAKAQITSPANGSTLSSSTVTFTWDSGSGITDYYLYVGTSSGANTIFNNFVFNGSQTVTGIPTNGGAVYVRLWSKIAGTWQYNDYSYTAPAVTKAQITSPANGATFTSSAVIFTWTTSANINQYYLYVGSARGGNEIFNNFVSNGSQTVGGIPTDGRTIYVTMWSQISGSWLYNEYTYTACSSCSNGKAQMTSPANGATLSSSTVTFTWSSGSGVSDYYLYIGTSPSGNDIFNSFVFNGSQTVSGIPVGGNDIYVRLWSKISGSWSYNDYTYHTVDNKARIISPTSGSTFSSSTVTFTWSGGSGVSDYYLYVGSARGGNEIFNNFVSNGSQTVGGIPTDGRTIYVTLWSKINSVWLYNEYTYQASR